MDRDFRLGGAALRDVQRGRVPQVRSFKMPRTAAPMSAVTTPTSTFGHVSRPVSTFQVPLPAPTIAARVFE
jgi:hypothetical protein